MRIPRLGARGSAVPCPFTRYTKAARWRFRNEVGYLGVHPGRRTGLGFALSLAPAHRCGPALLRFACAGAAEQSCWAGMAGMPLLLQGA